MNRLPSSEDGDDEEFSHDGSAPPRKKLRLTREQSRLLEDSFRQNHTLNPVNNITSVFISLFYFYQDHFRTKRIVMNVSLLLFFVKCRNKRKHLLSI